MFKVVRITWIDAVSSNDWKTIPDLKKEESADTTPCTTIGFLVRSNRQYYYVANTVSAVAGGKADEILVNGVMMIPKKWVQSYTELEVD